MAIAKIQARLAPSQPFGLIKPQSSSVLKLTVAKRFQQFALDIDLQIAPSFTALFGSSGSGKTTTLNMIAGLLQPSAGEILLNDRILFSVNEKINLPPRSREIGYIFQEGRLFPHFSVRQNLEFGLRRVPNGKQRFRFDETVDVLGVGHLLDRVPTDLSGGEKQRVTLGRALLASPDYLLMDEPLAALDLSVKLTFLSYLRDVHERFELPILYVSHDLGDVLNFAEQMVILDEGKNVAQGTPYSVLDQVSSAPLTAREDISNLVEVDVISHDSHAGLTIGRGKKLRLTLPHLDCSIGAKLKLNIPASEIILAVDEPKNLSASNIIVGELTNLHHLGERVLAEVEAGERFIVEIIPATVHRLTLQVGMQVFLIIKASSFRRLESS
jgi:molybdate transport system ATP-binding protein